MTDSTRIVQALRQLNAADDSQWTSEGMPRVEVVAHYAGAASLTRAQITAAAPEFSRATVLAAQQAPAPVAAQTTAAAGGWGAPPALPTAPGPAAVDGDEIGADDEADAIDEAIAELRRRVDHLRDQKAAVTAEIDKAVAACDALLNEKAAREKENGADAMRQYLKRQLQLREQKARQLNSLRESGLPIKDILAVLPKKAPIDEAMARRNKRGTARPTMTAKKG